MATDTTGTTGVQENIPLSESGEFVKLGTDVYRSSGEHVTLNEFKDLGLNFQFIPEAGADFQPTTTPTNVEGDAARTVTTTTAAQEQTDANIEQLDTLEQAKQRALAEKQEIEVTELPPPRDLTGMEAELAELDAERDSLIKAHIDLIDSRVTALDASTQATIDSIKQSMQRRKDEMKIINQSVLGSLTLMGVRSGRQRYASELQASILSEEERKGVQRLADLDAQEKQLIQQAKDARDAKEFTLLNQRMAALAEINDRKVNQLFQLESLAIQQENQLLQRQQYEWARKNALEERIFQVEQIQRQEEQMFEAGRQSVMTQAAQNGAPADILSSLTGATSIEDAITMATPWLKDPLLELQKAQLQASINKTYFDMQMARQAAVERLLASSEESDIAAGGVLSQYDILHAVQDIIGKKNPKTGMREGEHVAFGAYVSPGTLRYTGGLFTRGARGITGDLKEVDRLHKQIQGFMALEQTDKIKGAMSDREFEALQQIGLAANPHMREVDYIQQMERVEQALLSGISQFHRKYPDYPFTADDLVIINRGSLDKQEINEIQQEISPTLGNFQSTPTTFDPDLYLK